MVRPISHTEQFIPTPQGAVPIDQGLKLAKAMWEDLRTLTQAVQINVRANPQWEKIARTIAASTKSVDLTRGLSADAKKFKEKLQGRFGISHPSEQIESFCKSTLSQVRAWEKRLDQLKKK